MLRAGIDIGTNTILMVIGKQDEQGAWQIVCDEHAIARLGEGLHATGAIGASALARAEAIIARYVSVLAEHGVHDVYAVATSAMRDAANAVAVRQKLEHVLGHPINVIHGTTEAELTFTGSIGSDKGPCMVVDIGGGSTELSFGNAGRVEVAESINVGVVRLTESMLPNKPASAEQLQAAREHIRALVHDHCVSIPDGARIYAVAGTPVALAALELGMADFDAAAIHGHRLSRGVVGAWVDRLASMTSAQLQTLPGIHPQRADVLPAGALILHTILEACDAQECVVSTAGLRYGAMMHGA